MRCLVQPPQHRESGVPRSDDFPRYIVLARNPLNDGLYAIMEVDPMDGHLKISEWISRDLAERAMKSNSPWVAERGKIVEISK